MRQWKNLLNPVAVMDRYQVMTPVLMVPMALWLTVSIPIVVAAFGVLVFLARHPVDGDARVTEWVERNRVFCFIAGGVLVYLLFPSPVVLALVLAMFLAVARFGEALYDDAHGSRGGQGMQ